MPMQGGAEEIAGVLSRCKEEEASAVFVIYRTMNTNTVLYKTKVVDGVLAGVDVEWFMFEKGASPTAREGLNLIENQTAYGIWCKAKGEGAFEIVIVALQEKKIIVRIEDGVGVARTDINGIDDCKLFGVYVHMAQGWITPSVEHIELFGETPDGQPILEKKMKK